MHTDDMAPARSARVRRLGRGSLALVAAAVTSAIGLLLLPLLVAGAARAAEGTAAAAQRSDAVMMWGFATAAASTGIAALGAAYAVSHIGSAALGAMGERPELAGRALIFLGLAEGIAIYGLIISIMILARLG